MADETIEIEAAEGPSDEQFKRVSTLATQLTRAEETVALAEVALKEAQAALRQVSEIDLPQAMLDCGMTECKVAGGAKVELKTVYRASIPKERQPEAFAFLTNTGNGAVIKHAIAISFGREDGNQAARCVDLLKQEFPGKDVSDKESVHPQTLGALVKELIGRGVEVPLDVLGVYTQRYAKVTLPKEKKSKDDF